MHPKMIGSHYKQVAYYVPYLKNYSKDFHKLKLKVKKQQAKNYINVKELSEKLEIQGIFMTNTTSSNGKKWVVINGRRDVIMDSNPVMLLVTARKEVHDIIARCFIGRNKRPAVVHNLDYLYKDTYQDTKAVAITLYDLAQVALNSYLPDKEVDNEA